MKQNTFITQLWNKYGHEVLERLEEFEEKHNTLRSSASEKFLSIKQATDGRAGGTASIPDCIYLYLLVRYFKPRIIFEVGTWIGTSALFMAEALKKNEEENQGGHIYTCDDNEFYLLEKEYTQWITTISAFSDKAIDSIPPESKIDLIFTDGTLNAETIEKLKEHIHQETVIATHDFVLPGEKGVRNFVNIQKTLTYKFQYLLPKRHRTKKPVEINSSIAILLTPYTTDTLGLRRVSGLKKRLRTFFYTFTIMIGITVKIFKKIVRKISLL